MKKSKKSTKKGAKRKERAKEADIMIKTLEKQRIAYIDKINAYTKELHNMEPNRARELASQSLIRSGILTKNGNSKKNICSSCKLK